MQNPDRKQIRRREGIPERSRVYQKKSRVFKTRIRREGKSQEEKDARMQIRHVNKGRNEKTYLAFRVFNPFGDVCLGQGLDVLM